MFININNMTLVKDKILREFLIRKYFFLFVFHINLIDKNFIVGILNQILLVRCINVLII